MSFFRRATFISTIILALVAVFAALVLQSAFPILESDETLASNLGFFFLINVNIIAVMILGFVVVRNVIRLVIDRRSNILGARLRSRLVFAFVMLSMVPTALLFFVAQGMVERVLQDWFSPKVEVALDNSRLLAKSYYDSLESDIIRKVKLIHGRVEKESEKEILNSEGDILVFVTRLLKDIENRYPSVDITILTTGGVFYSTNKPESKNRLKIPTLDRSAFEAALEGNTMVLVEDLNGSEYLRAYVPLFPRSMKSKLRSVSGGESELRGKYVVVVSEFIPSMITNALADLLLAGDEYREFKSYRRPLASSYFLTLVVVTLLVIFAAISIGFFLAKSLAVPIGLLAEGTEQIANGNLTYQIPEVGDDELGVLVKAFNKMTMDLREATGELVSRSRYIETVLANVGVGVLSIDVEGKLRTVNRSVLEIFEIQDMESILEKSYKDVLPRELLDGLEEILTRSLRGKVRTASRSIFYAIGGKVKHLQLMITKLYEESQQTELGLVILVDDVTEFEKAQRMAAWQEVARRIAHEIKNPLTPIQLSAERIARMKAKLADKTLSENESIVIDEATDLIVKQVENLRVLVNEFSQFARMPRSELNYGDLNEVLRISVETFQISNSEIDFKLDLEADLPSILVDCFQMERVCLNLIDNAIASVKEANRVHPQIIIRSHFDKSSSLIIFECIDNGIGVADSDKSRLFEPYFTNKRGGTGLGLAIVKTVISDHNGFIRVVDNPSGGVIVRIELPVVR